MESDWERQAPELALDRPLLEARLARALPAARLVAAGSLAGGKSNTHLRLELADRAPVVMRLHQRDAGACAREAAIHRLLAGRVPLPALLHAEAAPQDGGLPWMLLSWCPGERLCDVLPALRDADGPALGAALGRVAATIHGARAYPGAGFLTPELALSTPLGPLGEHLRGWLDGRAGARLGPALSARLRGWLADRAEWLEEGPEGGVLCHADFKQENLLVAPRGDSWAPTAVLDWEFAFAGPCLFDLGQLLRREELLPPGFADGVAAGYAAVGPPLPADWRARAAALDLLNHVQFLDDPLDRPAVQAAARERIEHTLARWP